MPGASVRQRSRHTAIRWNRRRFGAETGDGDTATVQPAIHTAVISMDSRSNEAETLFRTAIVALEGIPGDQVEGISPLYHVSHLHGSDAMSAVMQMSAGWTRRR